MNSKVNTLKEIIKCRRMIIQLAYNDFKNKFAGSYLGVIWAFAQPIVIVSIYWMVFEKGMGSKPLPEFPDTPYLLWLIAGMCPWFFLNDSLNSSTNCLIEYGYIVKKVKFNIDIIPLIKIISAAFVHCFFILLVLLVYIIFGEYPTIYAIQMLYYSACVFIFGLGIAYFTSAVNVFFRDMNQIVGILLQYAMWVIPIMISESIYPAFIRKFLPYNPMYYIVEGYRDSLIRGRWFWERPLLSVYFWVMVMITFVVGRLIFKKMKPHFADVM